MKTIEQLKLPAFDYDCRKGKNAKKGLIDLCNFIESKLGNNIILVEIGTFSGISSCIFSQFFTKVTTIDPYQSGYDPNDLASNPDIYDLKKVEKEFVEKVLNNYKNIKRIKMKSEEAVKKFVKGSIDCIFIDGVHTYEGVKKDINMWKSKVKQNGIIAFHDYQSKHFQGVTRAVNETLGKPLKTFSDSSCCFVKRFV